MGIPAVGVAPFSHAWLSSHMMDIAGHVLLVIVEMDDKSKDKA